MNDAEYEKAKRDGTRLCVCGHFKNCHVKGSEKCVFTQLQAAYGYRDPECPCQGFVSRTAEDS